MKKVCLLGRGPSILALEDEDISDIDDFVLVNNHAATLQNKTIFDKIKDKNIYVICNNNQAGFIPAVLEKINVTQCVTNRLKPDWVLWSEYKSSQKKHHQGGYLNNLDYLPFLAEDEPYRNAWRGPKDRNLEVMHTYNGLLIEHMPEEAEQYLIEIYDNNLVCNCGYYATLYALLKLKGQHIVYYGMDFYDNIDILKYWYVDSPPYLSAPWRQLRMKYEGEHMKVLWNDYLTKYFPTCKFEFNTVAECKFNHENIIYNKIVFKDISKSNKTYL
jgi:hypothetical protein